ncbi:PH domain-containing protein [Natronolimnobius sp. AArcel1]|uniref:PH domain-containing protein n=1 Tax=Natronolimnobius sp. AArcel1 TaxID=1679093 RepID=UPI0013EE351F|nr:PH domain-containing protein [Natronolimnobius sp. AArcel1]NGM68977.1 PH domain-containing protein [Natronolimnobius sp. AArcel1]
MSASTPDWLHLTDEEEIVWESRPHPIAMGPRVPLALAIVLVGVVLAGWGVTDSGIAIVALFGVVLMIAGLIVAGIQYIIWTNTRYVITSDELYKKYGIISRDVTQFRLDRVQNTSLQQSTVGRVFGYGNLTVYTAGSGEPELTFERTPRPERASSVLNEYLGNVSAPNDQTV